MTDTIYNNKLIHEQVEKIMLKVYDNIKGTPIHMRLMRSLEEACRRYITARISPKQRESVALYNESIADLESIINEADRVKIKKVMNEDKTEKLI